MAAASGPALVEGGVGAEVGDRSCVGTLKGLRMRAILYHRVDWRKVG